MADGYTVEVGGLSQLITALREIQPLVLKELRSGFLAVAEVVRLDSYRRFTAWGSRSSSAATAAAVERSAAGFKGRVRASGLTVVEQSRRKTTGLRPDYGALMMTKALLPARSHNMPFIVAEAERSVDKALRAEGF